MVKMANDPPNARDPRTPTAIRASEVLTATPRPMRPAGSGLSDLTGCCLSRSQSRRSFITYAPLATAQKQANAPHTVKKSAASNRFPENSNAANSRRFFDHCAGRSSWSQSAGAALVETTGSRLFAAIAPVLVASSRASAPRSRAPRALSAAVARAYRVACVYQIDCGLPSVS